MEESGIKPKNASVKDLGITKGKANWNLSPDELVTITVQSGQGKITSSGALCIDTGEFTGRSPKDKFTVKDEITSNSVWWNNFNIPFEPNRFDQLHQKMIQYLNGKEMYVRDAYACADERYRMNLRVVTEHAWSNLFAYNMFLRPAESELQNFNYEWLILCAPGFKADPTIDGTRQHNFSILNFKKKIILIGGSGYTGEIKKVYLLH
jgi:phosphoenolpyruvate carboxykinase (ATP)